MIRPQREALHGYLDPTDAVEAPTAYYGLYHPENRTELAIAQSQSGRVTGFAARCQTGLDLFRPLVTLRCNDPETAATLLAELLIPGRPYIFFANINQMPLIGGSLRVENERLLQIYRLDPARFKPVMNVMIAQHVAPDGTPRYEIHARGLQAAAGINWQSPDFAEIYVHTEPLARRRGWGRSVVAACTEHVLNFKRIPLYLVQANNEPSRRLAESLGYVDTGARQIYADTIYESHSG